MKTALITLSTLLFLYSSALYADQRIVLGVKLLGAGWEGDNGSGGTSFDSRNGGQLGFNATYQSGKFYTGISLQGGEYNFTGAAPDQFTTTGRTPTNNVKVEQNDFDLLVGYYFWPNVSLFLDIKAVGNNWLSNSYEQTFFGLGIGATAYAPINKDWTLFGSFGFIGDGEIKDAGENKVGEGTSTALEIGASRTIDNNNHFNIGLKFRNYQFEHLNSTNQDYTVNAIFIGYNYSFDLN